MRECQHNDFTVRATLRAGEWVTILYCNNVECGKCVSARGALVRVDDLHKTLCENKDVSGANALPNDRKFDSRGGQW